MESRRTPSRSRQTTPATMRRTGSTTGAAGGRRTARQGPLASEKVKIRNSALNIIGGVKVDVYVRCRPMLQSELRANEPTMVEMDAEENQVVVHHGEKARDAFVYDKVFGEDVSQEQLYSTSVKPVVDQVLKGIDAAVLAYGQTGTGKSFTVMGDLRSESLRGITPRAVEQIFQELGRDSAGGEQYTVELTYLEVYNEQLEDILADDPAASKGLRLVDDKATGKTICHNLTKVPVRNAEHALEILARAEERCRIAETHLNAKSNRAHRIVTLVCRYNHKTLEEEIKGSMTLVDLAGSECISRSGAEGDFAKEAGNINKSLLTLGRVINALASKDPHIPYRDSKLTRLISEALGGECKTSLIATVAPGASHASETASTLRYAKNAREALNISQLPKSKQFEITINLLNRRVKELEQEASEVDAEHRAELDRLNDVVAQLQNDKAQLQGTVEGLQRDVAHEREEKLAVQQALGSMTAQRDRLEKIRQQLRAELKQTRQQRDGYLADKTQLMQVLQGVRDTRNQLLEAHRSKEAGLVADSTLLKDTIAALEREQTALLAEIERRKNISDTNEERIDYFEDDCADKLHSIAELASVYGTRQQSQFSGLRDRVSDMNYQRKKDVTALSKSFQKVANSVMDAHNAITLTVKEFEEANRAKMRSVRDGHRNHYEIITDAIAALSEDVSKSLRDVESQVTSLEESQSKAMFKFGTRVEELSTDTKSFVTSLDGDVQHIRDQITTAIAAHNASLAKHQTTVTKYLEDEKQTSADAADALMSDIQKAVMRLVDAHQKEQVRRVERQVVGLGREIEGLEDESASLREDVDTSLQSASNKMGTWSASHQESIRETDALINEHKQTASTLHKAITNRCVSAGNNTREDLTAIKDKLETHSTDVAARIGEAVKAAEDHTVRLVADVAAATGSAREQVRSGSEQASEQGNAFSRACTCLTSDIQEAGNVLSEYGEDAAGNVHALEIDIRSFTEETYERDPTEVPEKKEMAYPVDQALLAPYLTVLKKEDDKGVWTTEEKIRTGELRPGLGTDFWGLASKEDVLSTPSPVASHFMALDEAATTRDDGLARSVEAEPEAEAEKASEEKEAEALDASGVEVSVDQDEVAAEDESGEAAEDDEEAEDDDEDDEDDDDEEGDEDEDDEDEADV